MRNNESFPFVLLDTQNAIKRLLNIIAELPIGSAVKKLRKRKVLTMMYLMLIIILILLCIYLDKIFDE